MLFKKYASTKVIAIILASLLTIGGFFTQQHRINELKRELYIQQNITDQRHNHSETYINIKSLNEELNKRCEFKILDGTVNIKHTYVYERESVLGLSSKYKLVGTADLYYELTTDLSKAVIAKATTNEIIIEVPRASINDKACHRVANTFYRMDSECDTNILTSKKDTERATRQWEDTFDIRGIKHIKDYYSSASQQDKIEDNTAEQIQSLLRELGYSQNVKILVK